MRPLPALSLLLDKIGFNPDSGIRGRINGFLTYRNQIKQIQSIKPNKTYSQFGEDAVLQSLIPNVLGCYVDIGSGHPVIGSNTYALYKLGWKGVLVDPVPHNIFLSREIRKKDEVIQAAVGKSQSKSLTFYETDPYQYSTTSSERAAEVELLGHPIVRKYSVDIVTLAEIVANLNLFSPSVLSIDVEGNELEVLSSNDWIQFTPDFILVEEFEEPWKTLTDVRNFLETKGYSLRARCGFTSLYSR